VPVRLLIAGRPGSGKTTAVSRLAALLREAGLPVGGFVTTELRERGRRVGFEIVATRMTATTSSTGGGSGG
jgi:nucleoside-triphosphatase